MDCGILYAKQTLHNVSKNQGQKNLEKSGI